MLKPKRDYMYPEDWRILQRIAAGGKVVERETPNMGMPKSFTVGRGRTHYNSNILDVLAAHGFLDRATCNVTANGQIALIYRDIMRSK